jgi:hypothetical protein
LVAASNSARIDLKLSSALKQAIPKQQENRESGTSLGNRQRIVGLDHHRRIGCPAGAIHRGACGRRDRFDREKHTANIETWENPDVPVQTVFDAVENSA